MINASWSPLANLRVNNGGVVAYPPGATIGPERFPSYEFVWIIEGSGTGRFDDYVLDAPQGTILLSRPGMAVSYEWAERNRTVHAYFHFQCDAPQPHWPPAHKWPLAHTVPADDVLRPLFRYALARLSLREPLRSALLAPCVELMVRSFVTGRVGMAAEPLAALPQPVEKALIYIREVARRDPAPLVTLADVARAAHVSAEHLCRLFRRSLDTGPLECLRLARLDRAAALVGRSNFTFKEIAEATGFATPFHFSAAFKKIYGLPPRDYRAAVREGRCVRLNPLMKHLELPTA